MTGHPSSRARILSDRDISEIIFPAMWRSIQYNSVALVITLGIGIPLGVFAARRQGTWADPASIGSFLFLQSIPVLVSVPFLLLIFALKLGWLPARPGRKEAQGLVRAVAKTAVRPGRAAAGSSISWSGGS